MKNKFDYVLIFQRLKTLFENQFNNKIKNLYTLIMVRNIKNLIIILIFMASHTSHPPHALLHNGYVKRPNHHINETTLSLQIHASTPLPFLLSTVHIATCLI